MAQIHRFVRPPAVAARDDPGREPLYLVAARAWTRMLLGAATTISVAVSLRRAGPVIAAGSDAAGAWIAVDDRRVDDR